MERFKFGELIPMKNSGFSRVEVSVAYEGLNRNGSYLTSAAIDSIIESLPGSPVVGLWDDSKNDFDGHNMEMEIDRSGNIVFNPITKPYGFISQEKPQIKNIDGKNYVVAEAVLWTKRFPEVARLLAEKNNQSMELEESTLKYDVMTDGTPLITYAEISAICILGENVEPCFEEAKFVREGFLSYMLKQLEREEEANMENMENVVDAPIVEAVEEATEEVVVDFEAEAEVVSEPILEVTEDAEATEEVVEEIVAEEVVEETAIEEVVAEQVEIADEDVQEELEVEADVVNIADIQFELEAAQAELKELRAFKENVERNEKMAVLSDSMFSLVPAAIKENIAADVDNMTKEEIQGALALEVLKGGFSAAPAQDEVIITTAKVETVSEPAWVIAARNYNKK